ncbi:hypothetical protein ABKV19_026973 [Rosa sericea]
MAAAIVGPVIPYLKSLRLLASQLPSTYLQIRISTSHDVFPYATLQHKLTGQRLRKSCCMRMTRLKVPLLQKEANILFFILRSL